MPDHEPRIRQDERRDAPLSGRDHSHAGEPPPASSHGGRDVWRASASFGWLIGTLLLLLAGVAIVFLLLRVPSSTGGQRVAWIAIAAALITLTIGIAVVLRALPTMRYRFTADALVVEWLGQQRVVPLAEITDITYDPAQPLRLPDWEPFWPGYYVATVRTPAGAWHTWATQQPHRRVRLATAHGIVAISPERPVRFIAELERRRQAAGLQALDSESTLVLLPSRETASRRAAVEQSEDQSIAAPLQHSRRSTPESAPTRSRAQITGSKPPRGRQERRNPLIAWLLAYRDMFRDQFLVDQVASALVAVGVVLPVLMVAYLYSQYEGLPDQIPIHWDATGEITETTTPSGLWRFPRIAVVILIVNAALATMLIGIDRYLARLLVAGIPLAQIILFIALVRAVN